MYKVNYSDPEAQPFREIESKNYQRKKISPLDKYQMLEQLSKLIGIEEASKLVESVTK